MKKYIFTVIIIVGVCLGIQGISYGGECFGKNFIITKFWLPGSAPWDYQIDLRTSLFNGKHPGGGVKNGSVEVFCNSNRIFWRTFDQSDGDTCYFFGDIRAGDTMEGHGRCTQGVHNFNGKLYSR